MALASSLGCASTARISAGSRSRTETRSSLSAHSSTRRTLLLGSCILANSSSNSIQIPTQSQSRVSIVQAASDMANMLMDAHVHVWASVEVARSGKYPYYVSVSSFCPGGPYRRPWGVQSMSNHATQKPARVINHRIESLISITAHIVATQVCAADMPVTTHQALAACTRASLETL
jgi:hypothetical protein